MVIKSIKLTVLWIIMMIALTACNSTGEQIQGSYVTDIKPEDIPTGFGNTTIAPDDIALLSGQWQLNFLPDGSFTVTRNGELMIEEGHYEVNGNKLTVGKEKGLAACVGEARIESGIYEWSRDGDQVRFLVVDDKCGGRTVIFAAKPLTKVE